jgi:two-component system, OmpR family, sensor histidine kinase KdpD
MPDADPPLEAAPGEPYALKTLRNRGRHKIFLGYAPGVGKTFTMLAEAQRRHQRDEDIVIGFVETHGRKAIAELAEGLPTIPRKSIAYRGKTFEEMDTAAVIARRPAVVLVDELAHTNIPGSAHEKRWQSVEEILAAGIDVISTVNVQHFESLNDTIFQITTVRVRETLPDSMLDRADEVVLVDLTADALINRLNRGVVYDLEKIPGALSNFFRRGNLVALRELALRKTAEEVDETLQEYLDEHQISTPWATEDRVVVCIKAGSIAKKLVRRGYRLAKRLQGHFWVVHVHTPGETLGRHHDELAELFELTHELGGTIKELSGDSEAEAILSFARERRATFVVMGQSKRSRMDEVLRGSSLIARIMRETEDVDVLAVADPSKATREPGQS